MCRGVQRFGQPLQPLGPAGTGRGHQHVRFGTQAGAVLGGVPLREDGAELIDQTPRRGLGGHMIAFIHPRASGGILTELVQAH